MEDETIKGLIELLLLETQAKGRNGKAYVSSLLSALSAHYIQNYSNYRDLQDASAKSVKIGKSQIDKKYVLWVLGVIIWNYGFPIVPPLYDVIMAMLLKHILS